MKRTNQGVLFILMILGVSQVSAFSGKTFLSYRSQTTDYPRFLAGSPFVRWNDFQERDNSNNVQYFFEAIPAYTATFQPKKICNYLFGKQEVNVSGSMSGDMSPNRIFADYFGLPSDYLSTLHFCPTIQNFLVDFYWQVNFGCLVPGLSFAIHAPLVYSKWNLKMCETVINAGSNFYPAGYLSSTDLERSQLVATASNFFAGGQTFGDMQAPLKYGLICGEQHMMHLSDLQAFLQWQISANDERTLSLEIFGCAPTGNRPEAVYLFEPLVGNGKHWEFGVGAFGAIAWCNEKYNSASQLYWQFLISHLFPACQKRSFDFCANGPGSRYMLLEEIRTPVSGLFVNGVISPNQYQGRLSTAINHTTLDCSISVPVQIDLLVRLNNRLCGLDVELGYNLWFRSVEQLNWRKKFREDKYAVKGDAQIYGFFNTTLDLSNTIIPVALSATEHCATLCGGQGIGNFVQGAQYQNTNIDNPTPAGACNGINLIQLSPADLILLYGPDPTLSAKNINTSSPAILLTNHDIDDCSALAPNSLSHTFFAHVGYSGKENFHGWIPYVGVGAEVEYACFCFSKNSAVSQWEAWFKVGVSY